MVRAFGKCQVLTMAVVCVGGVLLAGCGLDAKECSALRSEGFEVVNEAHTCNHDGDCVGSEWPGCTKPVSGKNEQRVRTLHEKFTKGKCEEPPQDCRLAPEIYCKQGLCVFRERAPED